MHNYKIHMAVRVLQNISIYIYKVFVYITVQLILIIFIIQEEGQEEKVDINSHFTVTLSR